MDTDTLHSSKRLTASKQGKLLILLVAGILVFLPSLVTLSWKPILAAYYDRKAASILAQIDTEIHSPSAFACQAAPISTRAEHDNYQQAIVLLQKALQHTPQQAHFYYKLGQAYCRAGDYQQAVTALERFSSLRPHNPQANLELGFALEQLCPPTGPCVEREKAFKAWQDVGITQVQIIEIGDEARRTENLQDAIEWYQRAQHIGADLRSTIAYTEYLFWTAAQDGERAARNLAEAVETDAGWVDGTVRFLAWYRYGRLVYENEDWSLAEIVLKQAIDYHPGGNIQYWALSEVYRFLAQYQLNQNQLDQALPNLKMALEINPRNTWAFVSYGKGLIATDQTNINLAEQLFHQAVELAGTNPVVWRNIISILLEFNHSQRAAQFCDLAIQKGVNMEEMKPCPVQLP